ncbi:TIGR01620 family protein [Pasteurellaceae bacterium LIM206]|nr:TIGR01620 family protein [Pasteurellaceae bacterium LIM206]
MNDKRIFDNVVAADEQEHLRQKRIFDRTDIAQAEVVPDPDALNSESLAGEPIGKKFDEIVTPKPRWWKRLLTGISGLFLVAVVAQSVQWLVDTWRQNQWIYFVFALVAFGVVLLGVSALVREWRRLRALRRHMELQRESATLLGDGKPQSAVSKNGVFTDQDGEAGKKLCLAIAGSMRLDEQHPAVTQWLKQINDSHNAKEVTRLFSQNVLQSIDKQVKKLISRNAVEAGVVVAVSPLALVDMFFIAWRNLRLVNRIANIYGIELGYVSRLRLMKLVLMNIAFAGATELVQEIGMDWLSQDIAAKLSARAAQGIGVGLLTARLGIKTMEFCRPLAFRKNERPRLTAIHRELLSALKTTVLRPNKIKEEEKL